MTEGDTKKLRLMVVDDESDNLDLLYRTFRRDFQVFKATSAFEALEVLEQEGEMAIIISDQRMPKISGIEFLSRTVETFPDTIRIVLTGYTDVEDLVRAINTGKVFKYITKPWNPEELKTVVQQASETYLVLKQRTRELRRALRRESIFNAVTTAIRESLDYRSMLQTIVDTIGQTFSANACILRPVESNSRTTPQTCRLLPDTFSYSATNALNGANQSLLNTEVEAALQASAESRCIQADQLENSLNQLILPLAYQQEVLAAIALYRQGENQHWSTEEIELIEGVSEQAALAISQARLYQRIQQQTEQMRGELAVARQIQSNLLRQSWPELDSVKVQACCFPAREVGGDFFEVYIHPQGDIWLAVGDVSGKGVPAALFMASAISVLRRELAQEVSPEPHLVMRNLNHSLSEDLVSNNCFITMVLARYNPVTQKLVYANAGHIYPLVWTPQDVKIHRPTETEAAPEPTYLKVRGVPLGILPVWKAPAGDLTLGPGEVLLLASDGITEASIAPKLEDGEQAGSAMLHQAGLWNLLIQEQGALNLDKILAHIQSHNPVQEDDQTILSLEVL